VNEIKIRLVLSCDSEVMSDPKELAFRYDLFITPDWRDRFDTVVNENVELPIEGRILDVNCGTGAHAIELAARMSDKGEVIGIDPSAERVAIARAKAQIAKLDNVRFEQGSGSNLPFESDDFDAVVGDASLVPAGEIEGMLGEMRRVAQHDARVVLKLATRGSFGEFFSIYWEALHETGIDNDVLTSLERLMNEHRRLSHVEQIAERSGLRNVESFVSKEEFDYENAKEFLDSPLIADFFMSYWLEIVPERNRDEVRGQIAKIIDRERRSAPFDVSIKATVLTGIK
jgi:ubiquinone/menaquinone biosynthesis C-methylase UbiE